MLGVELYVTLSLSYTAHTHTTTIRSGQVSHGSDQVTSRSGCLGLNSMSHTVSVLQCTAQTHHHNEVRSVMVRIRSPAGRGAWGHTLSLSYTAHTPPQ